MRRIGCFREAVPIVAAVLVLGACHRAPSPPKKDPTDASGAVAPARPIPGLTPTDTLTDEARRVVLAWSDALNRDDPGALEDLYGEHVQYYGLDLPKSAVLQAKRAALRATTTFHQQVIGEIDVTPEEDSATAGFVKRSGPAGKMRDVRAKLVVRRNDGGALLIVEETDEVTEKNTTEDRRADCEGVAARVVNNLAEVKRVVTAEMHAAERSDGRVHFGGVGPINDENGGFSVGFGIHTDERYEAAVWYSVDRAGILSVTALGSDVEVERDALRAVERACKH